MEHLIADENKRPGFDKELQDIVDYVINYKVTSDVAFETAHYCLLDALGCAFLALNFPECCKLLGPLVEETHVHHGVKVPGTSYCLDPVTAAFNIGTLIRWLDFNDTWLAAEWGHPSDNLGGLLAVADYMSRRKISKGEAPFTVRDLWSAMIKAHEIQGIIALENSFNRVGLDHVVLVKVATTVIVAQMIGCTREEMLNALSLAWVDGQSLRTYRHAPNTGSRKSWAAGDATSRGVRLALMAKKGEMGYPSVLTAKKWGFYDVHFAGNKFKFQQSYESYVMENVLFKIAFPAEFHAQTAVECAIKLHKKVLPRLNEITKIELYTQEPAIRIISKSGPLYNPADRDHCLQYMVAIGLLYGQLTAEHYEDKVAIDPRIDMLRAKMQVSENPDYTSDYYNPTKRSIANAMEVYYSDGSSSGLVAIEYPIGHRCRREEGIPLLIEKFKNNLAVRFPHKRVDRIVNTVLDFEGVSHLSVNDFMDLFAA